MRLRTPTQPDHASVWQCSYLGGLELMSARYASLQFARHFHDTFVFELIEEGMDDFACGSGQYQGRKGDIVVINPNEVHTGQSLGAGPLTYRALYPSLSLIRELFDRSRDAAETLQIPSGVIRDTVAASKLQSAHRDVEAHASDGRACEQLIDAIRFFLRRHGQWKTRTCREQDRRTPLSRARDFLIERSAHTVPLEELADVAQLSPFHLNRQFRARFGLPPHQFQINTRVERARSMLRRGFTPVEVAIDCGFADQAHLTRCFRRHVGTTPARYANSKNVQERLSLIN